MYKKIREEGGAYSRAGTCLPLWPGGGCFFEGAYY